MDSNFRFRGNRYRKRSLHIELRRACSGGGGGARAVFSSAITCSILSGANCPGDEPIALEPQLIDLLVYLVCSPASRILSRDIWDLLARVFDAWGFERCLWGTDWTRACAVVNYEQAVAPFRKTDRLADIERAMLMDGACAKTYGWSPKKSLVPAPASGRFSDPLRRG